ncbi:ribokinase [Lacticaseibacillus sp. GG6-2]
MPNKIAIVGSINVDHILQISRLPQPGETLAVRRTTRAAGGKGANQAVAAARSQAVVQFCGAVGEDDDGRFMLQQLQAAGVTTTAVKVEPHTATGQAYILLQAGGENSILIQHGANFALVPADIAVPASDIVIAQLEVPQPVIVEAFKQARAQNSLTLLNPAPAATLRPDLLTTTDIIVPNETESAALTGLPVRTQADWQANADWFHKHGVKIVIITLGEQGAYISGLGLHTLVPAFAAMPVDTTAAGDTFIGAFSAELQPDASSVLAAVRYASMASALAIQHLGAQPSIPMRRSVTAALAKV